MRNYLFRLFEPLSLRVLFEAPKLLHWKRQLKVILFLPATVTFLQSCLSSKRRQPSIKTWLICPEALALF